jgi:hypothetical protein
LSSNTFEKAKPFVRVGRKATDLLLTPSEDSRVARRCEEEFLEAGFFLKAGFFYFSWQVDSTKIF